MITPTTQATAALHTARTRRMRLLLGTLVLCTGPIATGQGAAPATAAYADDTVPMADYLGLLAQISPAAHDGARTFVEAVQRRCNHAMRTSDLRQAIALGDGDPVLIGLIRASHLRDPALREHWLRQLRCPGGGAP